MVLRIGPVRPGLLLLALGISCTDHPMTAAPAPLEEGGSRVVLHASLATYPVAGDDPQTIAMSVSGGGAGEQGLRRYIGYHAWNITWRFESGRRGAECAVLDATVFLESRITLPEWDAPPNPDPALAAQWAEFFAALHEHEVGHQLLVQEGAERVGRTLLNVRGPHCDDLATKADSAAQAVLSAIRDEDARYDADTRHGATQGAIWPPAPATASVTAH